MTATPSRLASTLAQNATLQAAQLSILAAVSEVLTRTLDSEEALDEILAAFLDAAGTSLGAIYLVDADGRLSLRAQIGYNSADDQPGTTFFGHGEVLHLAMELGEPIGVPSARLPQDVAADLLARARVESMLITPLVSGEERLGVIVIGSANGNLGADWIAFAKAVGFQLSQTITLGRTVARLAASEQRFRDLVEGLDAIVWEADAQTWQFSFVSRRAEELLGYPIEQWLAEPAFWTNRIHPDDREQVVALCLAAVAEGRDHAFEYRIVTADGRQIWVREIVHVVPGGQGQARRLRGLTVDITEQKRLEEQFRQSQKMEAVGRLAGGVAHDFNNLLTAITGYCEILLSEHEPQHTRRGDIEQIKCAADRASALTQQLLAFSRRQTLAPRVLGLNATVAGIDKLLRRVIGEDIDLITVLASALGHVKADPGQIEQVIMNLAINARDAMPHGGKLLIETANVELDSVYASRHIAVRPGPYVLLAISDTGSGIDAETLSHIFEPFFTTKEHGKGTGLGLSTVYGIVKQSGGNIWVYSERGYGTTFKIYLPRVAESVESPQARNASLRPTHGSETILLVEDDETVRTLVLTILQRKGYMVLEAQHGMEAIMIAQRHKGQIRLLITDVVMPAMSGPELARRLALVYPCMKVLYISGYTDSAIVHRGVLEADTLFLQKPFTPSDLARKVREVLDDDTNR